GTIPKTSQCRICIAKLTGSKKEAYNYSTYGSTTNLCNHLRKHGINENNYKKFLNEHNKLRDPNYQVIDSTDADSIIDSFRQEKITRLLVTFIICDVQPLILLKRPSFKAFVQECASGYTIPCEKTVKKIIHGAYTWTQEQIKALIENTTQTINFTTDLWTAKKILLSCHYLPYPHTGEAIRDELKKVIQNWNLDSK
ncbi:8343_t:CDS:2, partial [Acaulospora morrowiae]